MAFYWALQTLKDKLAWIIIALACLAGFVCLGVGVGLHRQCHDDYYDPCQRLIRGRAEVVINGETVTSCMDYSQEHCGMRAATATWIAGGSLLIAAAVATVVLCCSGRAARSKQEGDAAQLEQGQKAAAPAVVGAPIITVPTVQGLAIEPKGTSTVYGVPAPVAGASDYYTSRSLQMEAMLQYNQHYEQYNQQAVPVVVQPISPPHHPKQSLLSPAEQQAAAEQRQQQSYYRQKQAERAQWRWQVEEDYPPVRPTGGATSPQQQQATRPQQQQQHEATRPQQQQRQEATPPPQPSPPPPQPPLGGFNAYAYTSPFASPQVQPSFPAPPTRPERSGTFTFATPPLPVSVGQPPEPAMRWFTPFAYPDNPSAVAANAPWDAGAAARQPVTSTAAAAAAQPSPSPAGLRT